MEQWQLESGLLLCARLSHSFAPFETRPPLLSSATRRRITSGGDVPGFPGYAKLHGTWAHPAFGSRWFSHLLGAFVATRLANTVVTRSVQFAAFQRSR